MRLKKWAENPILKPTGEGRWEKVAVLNPGAWYEDGKVYLLYRASGELEDLRIYFGLATSKDGFHFQRVSEEPVVGPSEDGFDAGCVEDARIVKFADTFYITYAARAFPPAAIWRGERRKSIPNDTPTWTKNISRSGLLSSIDLLHFERLGPITSEYSDDRDVILFPEKVEGKYLMFHRPYGWVGPEYGCERPGIWLAYSDDLIHWGDDSLLAQPQSDWEENRIGGSCPPIRTEEGWITIYHGVDKGNVYRTGVMLLDLEDPRKVIARASDFIMEPEAEFEKAGIVNNVVFPCGNVVIGGEVFVYYGGADTVCCVATIPLKDLLGYVSEHRGRSRG